MTVAQQLELGLSHHRAGRLDEAEGIYRKVLAGNPQNSDALNLLGMLCAQKKDWAPAVDFLTRAIEAEPTSAEAFNNLGFALASAGRNEEAIAAYRKAIGLKPELAAAHHNLGNTLIATGQIEKAVAEFGEVVRLMPTSAEAQVDLGIALKYFGRREEARAAFEKAIQFKPDYAAAHANLGSVLRDLRKLDDSIACFERAIVIDPGFALAHGNLANVLAEVGRFDDAMAAYRRAMELKKDNSIAHSNLILLMLFSPKFSAKMIRGELAKWNILHAESLGKMAPAHGNDADPDRRLRIGYVSPDLRDHVIGRNLLPLFRGHDHRDFEIFCYADMGREDRISAEFKRLSDHWRDTTSLSNAKIAELIRQDGIDILVDLSLHLGNNHLLVFARKPAPLQVTFAGYPGSTGLSAMEYRLSDPYLDPPGETDGLYSEKTIRLADSFWCYDPSEADFAMGPLPFERNGFVTFGSLNNFAKVNGRVVELWSKVLNAVTGSRMLALCPEGSAREMLLKQFEREGIHRSRIELTANRPRPAYFELYKQIDMALDTVPYNGHTTGLDTLWMGVPVVTLVGDTVVGRAGLSQLSNIGLGELVARTPGEFVKIAASLAADPARLASLRKTLRERMLASALTDGSRFARSIETAYRQMWREWCGSRRGS